MINLLTDKQVDIEFNKLLEELQKELPMISKDNLELYLYSFVASESGV